MQNTPAKNSSHLVFIDYWKSFAIFAMIIYHFIFDLNFFNLLKIDLSLPLIRFIQLFSGLSFILISGLLFSYNFSTKFPTKRFIVLSLVAFLISITTWIYPNQSYIKFGIIHFLALSTLIGYFTQNLPQTNKLILGSLIILLGFYFQTISTNLPFLFFLNILTPDFSSLDFYPFFPFFGIFLLGQYLSSKLFLFNFLNFLPRNSIFEKISKHSLLIYLLHQPLLIFLILLLSNFP